MGKNSKIEWCDHTWNPWYGCKKVSTGCKNCYMYRDMQRTPFDPHIVTRAKPTTFRKPLNWKEPAKVFTCSWSDFFVKEADPWREKAMEIIANTPHLTYQILTKRPERILEWLDDACWPVSGCPISELPKNVWIGISAENQKEYERRVPYLLEIKASVRFVSLEPLLGQIDIDSIINPGTKVYDWHDNDHGDDNYWCQWCGGLVDFTRNPSHECHDPHIGIDWIIVGGESGTNARPMHPNWVRSIRDKCIELEIAFFFKQWGAWIPANNYSPFYNPQAADKSRQFKFDDNQFMVRFDKKTNGCFIDGRTWSEMPNT